MRDKWKRKGREEKGREGYVPPSGRAFLPCVLVLVLVLPGLGLTVVRPVSGLLLYEYYSAFLRLI